MRATATWQVQLLGRVQARSADLVISRWPSRAVAALLARLVLMPGREHGREELVEMLWPGVPPDLGRPRLRQALSLLRSLLRTVDGVPPVLLADRRAVRLEVGAFDCDVWAFERLQAQGDAAGARALYAGELMPGFYDDWIVAERDRLLTLHEGLDRRAAPALPTPASRPAPAAAETDRLPTYWTRAFGQDDSLQRLLGLLRAQRLVNLIGPGGQGKTRLAVAAARALAGDGACEGALFVPLADADTAAALWSALAQAVADNEHDHEHDGAGLAGEPRSQVLASLRGRQLLLVLDNLEQLDDGAEAVIASLLQQGPGLRLLLTSRRRLGLAGEQLFEVPCLPVPPPVPAGALGGAQLAALEANPAVALFVDRARQSRAEFHLTADNARSVAELVRGLAGMPLAIELAASRLRALRPQELLQHLQAEAGSPTLDLLARPGAAAGSAGRHASMRQVVAWSWRQLNPEVAALLCAMSVFTRAATPAAAAQAAGMADPLRALSLLADAADVSMLQVQGTPAGSLYALLPPVREYAAECCTPAEAAAARGRVRLWLAAQARKGLPQRREALLPDLAHARSLLQWARADDEPAQALALAVAVQGEWNWQPWIPGFVSVLSWALQRLSASTGDTLVSQAHYLLACLHQLRGHPAAAAQHADQAVATASDDRSRALALSVRSWVAQERGADAAPVQAELDAALALARGAGDVRVQAMVLRNLAAQQAYHRGDAAAAEALFAESVRLFESIGDAGQTRMRQVDLAACWALVGRAGDALALLQRCLDAGPAGAKSIPAIYVLAEIGRVQLRLRAPGAARVALVDAAQRALQNGWHGLLLPILLALPEAWVRCGQAEAAARLQGHLLARWPGEVGAFKRVDARAGRRTGRLLALALGPARARSLQHTGAGLTRAQVLHELQALEGWDKLDGLEGFSQPPEPGGRTTLRRDDG